MVRVASVQIFDRQLSLSSSCGLRFDTGLPLPLFVLWSATGARKSCNDHTSISPATMCCFEFLLVFLNIENHLSSTRDLDKDDRCSREADRTCRKRDRRPRRKLIRVARDAAWRN